MSITQGKSREIVLQLLFAIGSCDLEKKELLLLLQKQLKVSKEDVEKAFQRANLIVTEKEQLDKKIEKHALSYSLERIGRVERNILRIALYEAQMDDTIPEKVSLSEALRIAKKFSSPSAATFVHAILNSILTELKGD